MFDSGSARSFIKKSTLTRTSHLPINYKNSRPYFLADGNTTFQVIGTVKIFIEVNQLQTSMVVSVVESLCVDCILGMDYIDKYQVNLLYKHKQVQIHAYSKQVNVSMENQIDDVSILCRVLNPVYINPYQERRVKIVLEVSSGQILFIPTANLIQQQGLISSQSLITVNNHVAWISVYNSTEMIQRLRRDFIIGIATPFQSLDFISTIFDSQTAGEFDVDQANGLTSISEQHIGNLLEHVQDQQQRNELQRMLRKHHQLFDDTRATIAQTTIPHVICTGDNPPPASRPYPQTREKQKATFEIVQQMLRDKQIRPSHSQYAAPVLLIKKRDDSYRFVVDYRKLNNITVQDRFPLPNIEQTLQAVAGHRYYSKLDLHAGYFQIPIREDDKHKTAFITVHGLYEFNVLAQGLKNSPPSFQRIMSSLLLPCRQFSLVYLDDILIYSDSFEQHLQHLNQVLAILNKHKFQLNPRKCEVMRTTIDYLGHTINITGIKPLQDRIEAILAIPQPKTLKQANAFIGAIGWYRKFVKNFAEMAAPILAVTNLTSKNKYKFKWDARQRQAFDDLKAAITSEPLFLTYPDPELPLILSTDASELCVGGILYQEIDGIRRNIYFHSQILPKAQQKWPTIEKEALAIYHCTRRMRLYLLGREFIVQTDHCPLRDMHKKPINNRRVDRISLVLQQYDIKEVRHVAGKCNCMADYLSRYPCQVEDDDEFLDPDFGIIPSVTSGMHDNGLKTSIPHISSLVGAVMTRAQVRANVEQQVVNQENDSDFGTVTVDDPPRQEEGHESDVETVTGDDHPPQEEGHDFDVNTIADVQKEDTECRERMVECERDSNKGNYVVEDGILYRVIKRGMFTKKLLVVPMVMVNRLLKAYHDSPWAGHFGFQRTYMKLQDKYWWSNMKTSIGNYIQSCIRCQRFNVNRQKPPGLLHPIESPSGPFQFIGIDFSGPFPVTPQGNKYVLAITDYFSKWVVAIPLPSQTAQVTAEALYEHYICIYGIPIRILSDQGTHFNNQLMSAFTKVLGCQHIKSTPYHPQTNGAIERFNSTFERQLAKLTDQEVNDWDMHLKSIVFAYNTGQHATTKFSPYQLQFGREPRLPPDRLPTSCEFYKPNDYFYYFKRTIQIYQQYACENMKRNQQIYKQQFDKNRKDIFLKVGDQVLQRFPNSKTKLSALYSHPMIVIDQRYPTYWVKDLSNQKVHQVHVSQLRQFKPDQLA